jgi:hypothetical protein
MKKLIEKSIELGGIGNPRLKNIFTIEKEEDKKDNYRNIADIAGRKMTVFFDYQEGETKKSDRILLPIDKDLKGEVAVKDFIVSKLNEYLSK